VAKEVTMRRSLFVLAVLASFVLGGMAWWRRHPRFGSGWVNRVVDPWLVRQGIVAESGGEIGLIEHVGRKSGIVRVSPVHPVPTENGFRIIVPLGLESQWAQNVLTAGRCRLQVGEVVYELDEPMLVSPMLVEGLPPAARRLMVWLGFNYLELHRFAESPGTLVIAEEALTPEIEPEPELLPV
jgi:deazaflavin-dependent oxidoreductase (nitroreductase family)